MRHSCRLLLPLLLALAPALFAQTAAIQGSVKDDSGQPVPGAHAVATLQSPTNHSTYTALTSTKGEYSLNNLPSGRYSICVHSPGAPYLNNCQWATAAQATVAAGQTLTAQNITVGQGAVVQLRLDDPKKLITPTDDIFLVIYLPNGMFHPMRLASRDAAGRTYDVSVPLKSSVRATLISSHLQIADDKGKSLAPPAAAPGTPAASTATSATLTFPGQSASHGPPVTFTVTGRK